MTEQLIVRHHTSLLGELSVAIFSYDLKYRYSLVREWNKNLQKIVYVLLNPSTATELENDPTVERCERRARQMEFGSFEVVNIFAFRSTDPKQLATCENPIGDYNDLAILESLKKADTILGGWGNHGEFLNRGKDVAKLIQDRAGRQIHVLGITKSGHPWHPLYISYKTDPTPWRISTS